MLMNSYYTVREVLVSSSCSIVVHVFICIVAVAALFYVELALVRVLPDVLFTELELDGLLADVLFIELSLDGVLFTEVALDGVLFIELALEGVLAGVLFTELSPMTSASPLCKEFALTGAGGAGRSGEAGTCRAGGVGRIGRAKAVGGALVVCCAEVIVF